ncbi:13586_t:CDS:2 [Dentiscutata heterogama]|uniref:13586_t:CDS:1 n=1 Tax=Dentiscutata heterogama TaxID=1316150 RepID=A0ACA9N8E4_9GLOM|nr:13586_t:CDS:2 [Dentiscutata heterogama]
MSQIPPQVHETIEQFFKSSSTWSLFSFLKYRECVDDFTYDKVKEHMLYKSALNLLSKDHDQARKCLLNFEPAEFALAGESGVRLPSGNERSSEKVLNFWTTIEKKRYGDLIDIARADGVLRMLEGTTAGQQHVFNIQQQDLLGLYQSGDNDLTNTSMMTLSNILNHPGKRKSEGDRQPKTPPMRPRKVTVTTPEKPTLYKHSMQHLAKHFSVYVNNQCVIMKVDHVDLIPKEIRIWIVNVLSSEKDVFENNIMASLNSTPAHPFQQVCKTILYDFFSMTDKGPLNRFIGERKYTVDRIVPLFKAIQSVYREYSFDWIEVQASCIKDIKELFPEFDFTLNKVDGIGSKVSSNKEIIFIEVSGGPENAVLKHIKEDTEKLIKEAMFGLISLLRGYLGKDAEKARNICVYMVQCIGDRITLSELCLDKKHFYKISQIKSAMLPFSFDEVEKFMEVFELLYALIDGLKKQTRELKKLMLSDPISNVPTIRDWIWVPKNLLTWEATEVIYEDLNYEDLNYED